MPILSTEQFFFSAKVLLSRTHQIPRKNTSQNNLFTEQLPVAGFKISVWLKRFADVIVNRKLVIQKCQLVKILQSCLNAPHQIYTVIFKNTRLYDLSEIITQISK